MTVRVVNDVVVVGLRDLPRDRALRYLAKVYTLVSRVNWMRILRRVAHIRLHQEAVG